MSSEDPQKTGLEEKQHSNSILLLKNKDLNRNLSPLHLVAGVAGFEPTNVGTKSRCLTTWRHPNNDIQPSCGGKGGYQYKFR